MSGYFTLPWGQPLIESLARVIEDHTKTLSNPWDTHALMVFVPNHRSVLALYKSLQQTTHDKENTPSLILPQIYSLGDITDDRPLDEGLGNEHTSDYEGDALTQTTAHGGQSQQKSKATIIDPWQSELMLCEATRRWALSHNNPHNNPHSSPHSRHSGSSSQTESSSLPDNGMVNMRQYLAIARRFITIKNERIIAQRDDPLHSELESIATDMVEGAEHWQHTFDLLCHLDRVWQQWFNQSSTNNQERRCYRTSATHIHQAALENLCQSWRTMPPQHPVIAGGSTGSRQATRDLLKLIADLDHGLVLLPPHFAKQQKQPRKHSANNQAHPMSALWSLTGGVPIALLPHTTIANGTSDNDKALSHIMNRRWQWIQKAFDSTETDDGSTDNDSAEITDNNHTTDSYNVVADDGDEPSLSTSVPPKETLTGVSFIVCNNEHDEAELITATLIERWQQGKRVGFISSNNDVTREVRGQLARYVHTHARRHPSEQEPCVIDSLDHVDAVHEQSTSGINHDVINDSIGYPLSQTLSGSLALAIINAVARPGSDSLWGLLCHPLCGFIETADGDGQPRTQQSLLSSLESIVFSGSHHKNPLWLTPPKDLETCQTYWTIAHHHHPTHKTITESVTRYLERSIDAMSTLTGLGSRATTSNNADINNSINGDIPSTSQHFPLATWLTAHYEAWTCWCGNLSEPHKKKVEGTFVRLIMATQKTQETQETYEKQNQAEHDHDKESFIFGSDTPLSAEEYQQLFTFIVRRETCRAGKQNLEAPIQILGRFEARLLRFDCLVIGSLYENCWPQEHQDPWLNAHMIAQLGLINPEQRLGLQSMDLIQALGNREVVMIRPQQHGGEPTLPSRWVLQLEHAAQQMHREFDTALYRRTLDARADLFAAPSRVRINAPEPILEHKEQITEVSITDTETLRDNPYAFYTRRFLRLYPRSYGNRQLYDHKARGTIVHRVIENFINHHLTRENTSFSAHDTNAYFGHLMAVFDTLLNELYVEDPVIRFFWTEYMRGRLGVIQDSLQNFCNENNQRGALLITEQGGQREFPSGISLKGRVDLVLRDKDQRLLAVGDIKTQSTPFSQKKLTQGELWQLPLAVYLLSDLSPNLSPNLSLHGNTPTSTSTSGSGFDIAMSYLIIGNRKGEHFKRITASSGLIDSVVSQIEELCSHYNHGGRFTVYPKGKVEGFYDQDIAHLARLHEWSALWAYQYQL